MFIKKILFITFLSAALLAVQTTDEDFADQLFQTGDYPNAIYTYKKVIFLNKSNDNAKYKLARSFYLNGQKEESSALLDELVENSVTHKKFAQKELSRQYYQNEEFDRAAFEFKDFSQSYKDDSALYLAGWAELKQNNYQKSSKTFGLLAKKKESSFGLAALKLKDKVLEGEKLPQKNILAAQIMSGILPGSGQIYAGNWQDGLVSFLVNGLTISLMSNALQGKRGGEALVWLTLESAWYFGGIYSAGNSVHKYNETVRARFIEDLEEEYHPEKILE
jgi:tetratricopeptide (TPR) repeat protein